jgi:hypothetical protein
VDQGGGPVMGDIPVVLVVEDEWLLRDCLAAHLRAARWHVLQARSGEALIALLHAGKHVDVVVTGRLSSWRAPVAARATVRRKSSSSLWLVRWALQCRSIHAEASLG